MIPQSASGARGSSSRPRREKARGRLRPPALRLRGKTTPQLGASGSPLRLLLLPLPATGLPLCWSGALETEEEGWGAGSLRGVPLGTGSSPGTPGPALPRRTRPSSSGRRPAPLQRPRFPSPPAPRRHQPSNFVSEDQPLSPPCTAPAPARPRRPPPAGLRERGARSHLTARPVNQRPPCAPSGPAAASPALSRSRAARPRGSGSGEREWMPRTNTIPFIQSIRKCESHPHPSQTG